MRTVLVVTVFLSVVFAQENLPSYPDPLGYGDGPCLALVPAYTYNPRLGACELTVYGGCPGRVGTFSTYEECAGAHIGDRDLQDSSQ